MTNTDGGWIKLHRKFLKWEWYDDPNVVRVFLHCLLMANHEDKKYRGKMVKRGSFLTGLKLLAKQTKLSVQSVRTALSKLKSTNELTIASSSIGSHIQVVNYDLYQQVPSGATNEQQTSNKRATTNKNNKNIKEEIGARKNAFKKTLLPYKEKYTTELLKSFYEYWTEENTAGTKMRFEDQQFWSIGHRLSTWKKKEKDSFKQQAVQEKISITTGEFTR